MNQSLKKASQGIENQETGKEITIESQKDQEITTGDIIILHRLLHPQEETTETEDQEIHQQETETLTKVTMEEDQTEGA